MSFPKESPYEILGTHSSVSLDDLMRAYKEAIKRRQYSPSRIAQAFNDLRNPQVRAEYDLLVLPEVETAGELSDLLTGVIPPRFIEEHRPAIIPLVPALTALSFPFSSAEMAEIDIPQLSFEWDDNASCFLAPEVLLPVELPA